MTDSCPSGLELLSGHACAILLQQHPLAAAPLHMHLCVPDPVYVAPVCSRAFVCLFLCVPVPAACACVCMWCPLRLAFPTTLLISLHTLLINEAELQRSAGPSAECRTIVFLFGFGFGGEMGEKRLLESQTPVCLKT